jgi:SAM-dependent methyltransferase
MDSKTYSRMAKHYDPAYGARPDLKDVPFYLEMARRQGGPILEIACGTGRVLLEIARLGIEIVGVDYSEAMLAVLRSKLVKESPETRERVTVHVGDMRTFSLGRQFRQVFIPFRPMQHMYTVDDQISALTRAGEHLRAGGLLVFDVFYPIFSKLDEKMDEEELDSEWVDPDNPQRTVRRYFVRHSLNRLQQYFEGEFIFRTYQGDELVAEERSPLAMSYYTYPHMLLLFKHCGLEIVEEYGSFDRDPIDICREMIFVLRRR